MVLSQEDEPLPPPLRRSAGPEAVGEVMPPEPLQAVSSRASAAPVTAVVMSVLFTVRIPFDGALDFVVS